MMVLILFSIFLQPTDEGYETLTNDCPNFIKSRGYVMTDNPEAEEFPIAYR